MRFLIDIFSKHPEMPIGDIQRKKGHYTSLYEYYTQKIEYLSNKHLNEYLLSLATKDLPSEIRGKKSSLGKEKYRKECLKYYEKQIKEINIELKKISKIKIKRTHF